VPADNGRFETRELAWGFSAAWQGAKGKLVYNTRLESALRREGMWASAVAHGRCILPVAAFFEPHRSETQRSPRTGRQGKRPYVFTRRDKRPLLIAGVHEHEQLSLLTTEPNADVSPVHPRMPLVLEPHEVRLWLEGDIAQLADRSRIGLSVRPEHEDATDASVQQSLF
jgi:putative SOS response-associated peptidase YedK